jgi:hypothetical protein
LCGETASKYIIAFVALAYITYTWCVCASALAVEFAPPAISPFFEQSERIFLKIKSIILG